MRALSDFRMMQAASQCVWNAHPARLCPNETLPFLTQVRSELWSMQHPHDCFFNTTVSFLRALPAGSSVPEPLQSTTRLASADLCPESGY